jgi:FkbM family methyltransferase
MNVSPTRFGSLKGHFSRTRPFPGKMRIVESAALIYRCWKGNVLGTNLWRALPFNVDLRDRIQRQMWAGCYEQHVSACLASILRPGHAFIDIGAHIGYHSYFAAGIVGQQGAVFSFEPDPSLFLRLSQNLAAFPYATAFNYAVWESETQLTFESSSTPSESGWGTLTAVRDLNLGMHTSIHTVSLDSWCTSTGIEAIRAIKIDAEGAELRILFGAASTLRRYTPILLFEINPILLQQCSSQPTQILQTLKEHAYEIYALSYKQLMPISDTLPSQFADCLAVPADLSGDALGSLVRDGWTI